jgi:uncharacterized protein YukE
MTSVDNYVPGDASAIRDTARRVATLGTEFGDAARELQSVADSKHSSDWYGAAATQFEIAIEDLPRDLRLMSTAHEEVSSALSTYAALLEGLQRQAKQAVERWKVKTKERDAASREADRARARINQLTAQLGTAKATEAAAWTAYQTARLSPEPYSADATYRVYVNARDRSQAISNERSGEQDRERTQSNIERDAAEAVRKEERSLNNWRDERKRAERTCADKIRNALPKDLKNPSNFEKARRWAGDQIDKFADLAKAVGALFTSGSWTEFVANVREVAKALSNCLDVIAVALVIAGAALTVAAIFTGGATLPLALAMFKGAAMLHKISIAAKGVAAVTGIGLAVTGAKIDGRRVVTAGEAFGDSVSFGLAWGSHRYGEALAGKLGVTKGIDKVLGKFIGKATYSNGLAQVGYTRNMAGPMNNLQGPDASLQIAKSLFRRDYAQTVYLPTKLAAATTVKELGGFVEMGTVGVGEHAIQERLIPDRPPWEPPDGGVRASEIVREAGVSR